MRPQRWDRQHLHARDLTHRPDRTGRVGLVRLRVWPHAWAVGHAPRSRHGGGRCTIRGARSGPPCRPLCCAASPDADAERPLHLLLRRLRNAARRGMRHSVWHHATLAAGSSRRTARQREGCEARGRQAVRQTRDSGPRSQGPPRPTKQEINHLHLGSRTPTFYTKPVVDGCFRNALLLLSVLHTLVNAMKPGNPRATSSAALRAASRSWGTGQ